MQAVQPSTVQQDLRIKTASEELWLAPNPIIEARPDASPPDQNHDTALRH